MQYPGDLPGIQDLKIHKILRKFLRSFYNWFRVVLELIGGNIMLQLIQTF